MHLFQKAWIAVLVLHTPLAAVTALAIGHLGCLQRLLRPFPGGPGLPFDPVDLFQFDLPGQVEIADGRLPPSFLDPLEIDTDGGLLDPDPLADLHLRQALQVKVGHLLTP